MNRAIPSRAKFLAMSLIAATYRPAGAQVGAVMRVAAPGGDGFAGAFYARDQGWFERAGLNVDVLQVNNGTAAVTAVVGGTADIGASSVTAVANAVLHGIPLRYIAGATMFLATQPDLGLCVSKDAVFRGASDLVGKTVAVGALKDGTDLALKAYLSENHVDSATVDVVELPFPSMAAAIGRGNIFAATLVEPFLSAGTQTSLKMVANPEASIAPRLLLGGWFATRRWAEENRAFARRFAAVMYETNKWANVNHAKTAAILAKVTHLDPDTIAHMNRSVYAEALVPGEMQPQLTWAARLKFTDSLVQARDLIEKL